MNKQRPKFLEEQGLSELANSLRNLIDEESFDTMPRETLYGVIERLERLAETHTPDILRDLRDMGWRVHSHRDVEHGNYCPGESLSVQWTFFKPDDEYGHTGTIVETTRSTDEEALWSIASHVAFHELETRERVKKANALLKKDVSFKKAIEIVKKTRISKKRKAK